LLKLGADFSDGTCKFSVWAPDHEQVSLFLAEKKETMPMKKNKGGYWQTTVSDIKSNAQYMFQLDGRIFKPDPASHFQPNGVFGNSAIEDHEAFKWNESEKIDLKMSDLVFYELHVGTFTPDGTFKAIEKHLEELADLGITAIELMPVAQFSGRWNWGYDGVFPYAVQNSYGTPDDLKRLVQCCHEKGLAIFLDTVYNHLGPEGNVLPAYAPYFSERHLTPWGSNLNFDASESQHVRRFFIENALYWFRNYHVDGLRLDAVHAIPDDSPTHFLKELAQKVDAYSKKISKKLFLIAESNQNKPTLIRRRNAGGYGLDAQWADDFHHSLHTLLTKEKNSYYVDFGNLNDMAKALGEAYVYTGQYSQFFKSSRGESAKRLPSDRFVVFSQNHDQTGNRTFGERLISLAGFEAAKLAAAVVILSPFLPLLFMGEEYGETAPFLYFTDFQDKALVENVRKGRAVEHGADISQIPDPQSQETFEKAKLHWQERSSAIGKTVLSYYKKLLRLRKALRQSSKSFRWRVSIDNENIIVLSSKSPATFAFANFSKSPVTNVFMPCEGGFRKILDSADAMWDGQGSNLAEKSVAGEQYALAPFSIAVYINPENGEQLD
jgi:maltooligosyltrehalose trehalohydrolase